MPVYGVLAWTGEPVGAEGQPLAWVTRAWAPSSPDAARRAGGGDTSRRGGASDAGTAAARRARAAVAKTDDDDGALVSVPVGRRQRRRNWFSVDRRRRASRGACPRAAPGRPGARRLVAGRWHRQRASAPFEAAAASRRPRARPRPNARPKVSAAAAPVFQADQAAEVRREEEEGHDEPVLLTGHASLVALERDEVPVVLLFLGRRALALVAQQRRLPTPSAPHETKIEQREGPEGVRGRQYLAFVGADHFLMLTAARWRLGLLLSFDAPHPCLSKPAALGQVGLSAAPDERFRAIILRPGVQQRRLSRGSGKGRPLKTLLIDTLAV